MFHHFPDDEAVGQNCLVRSIDFQYRNVRNNPDDLRQGHPIASFLASITQCGYRRQQDGFLRRTMPPLELEYNDSNIHEELREIELESLENLPYGIDSTRYQWLDLDGEGASGIVSEQEGGWFYKRNISPLNARQNETVEAVLSPVELIARQPSLGNGDAASQMFLDLAGDGQVDLVHFGRPVSGYFERSHSNNWSKFVPFESVPSISVDDPNVKFVDLTGDGHADILISEDEVFVWYPSLGEAGFATATKVAQALDEEEGPRLVFADTNQSIYLSDFSGDGLTDLVRIRNGEVCYWPNLGYGKFGAKVTMDNAPWFEEPDQFHQRRVLLADIDGSGVTDIIYLGRNSVDLYFNESGNSFSERHSLTQIPATDNLTSIAAIDLLGNGTACLVWSSSLPGNRVRSLRYVDIMGGQKPHLLVSIINNLGAETRIQYAPSTSFYMEDKFAGRPWLTKLPFPVQVVERIETLDHVSRNRFVTRYTYHHGYFDGGEREFRGFGMVEQLDTEELAVLSAEGTLSQVTNIDPASHVPPVVTRTWFHTGALIDAGRVSRQFEDDYYHEGDPSLGEELNETQRRSMLLDDTIIPNAIRLPDGSSFPWTITADEAIEASRSLKGAVLRQEVYAFDGSEEMDRPYLVSESNYTIEMLQPRGSNLNAVFFTHAREKIDFNYERKLFDVNGRMLADPRVSHSMTLAVDGFGNITESVAIAYGRRHRDSNPLLTEQDHQRQQQSLITYTANRFTNAVVEDDSYRTPAPAESRTYELFNVEPAANEPDVTNLFRFEEMLSSTLLVSDGLHDIPYENVFGEGVDTPGRRIIEHKRSLYRRDDLSGPLPSGELQSSAIEFENYDLAFTPGLLVQVYGDRVNEEMLANESGYVHFEGDGNWWIPSGRTSFSQNPADTPPQELTHALESFFLPQRFSDQFGNTTSFFYDSHFLLPVESRNALGSRTLSENDYRVLQPRLITDANGNRTGAVFNELGLVTGTAQMGKENEQLGDSLDNFEPDLDEESIAAHIQNPLSNPHVILGSAGSRVLYDLHAYHRTSAGDNPQPIVIYTLTRETHVSDPLNESTRIQHSFTYSDGFGREIQTKVQAEAGPLAEGEPDVDQRWVGSGWTIFNNKGKPVKQYEPFFSATHQFEFARTVGVSPVLF
ncbi:MAG TPA: toxin TcdB middle/N-terminal domain-containing protein, partial [Pyrinomonadaceae bacterium]|nr:toxin TcdB middle/N-terminal domain-containing protein [Pyrinomonadaceae bacterium]